MTISEQLLGRDAQAQDSQNFDSANPLNEAFVPNLSFLISQTISDQIIGMTRPEALAETLYIASSILSIGVEKAYQRIIHDVPLLTRRSMKALIDQGYEEELITDERVLAMMARGRARGEEPPSVMYMRTINVEGRKEIARIALLPGGRSPWGVSIAPLSMTSGRDIEEAVTLARHKVMVSIEMVASYLDVVYKRPPYNSIEAAIVRSTRSYDLALSLAQVDPEFVRSVNEKLLGSESERCVVLANNSMS